MFEGKPLMFGGFYVIWRRESKDREYKDESGRIKDQTGREEAV